jgi:glycogen phosphorylase
MAKARAKPARRPAASPARKTGGDAARGLAQPGGSMVAGGSAEALRHALLDNLLTEQGRTIPNATPNDWYMALARTVRDRMLQRWLGTYEALAGQTVRVVSYLSAEFLMGPQLGNNMLSLGITDAAREACRCLGLDLDALMQLEEEPGLGNGGLGRLAACTMDSLATLQVPAIGYGIRYEFGIFDQVIRDGGQVEIGDTWLKPGNPWEIHRPEVSWPVGFGGRTEWYTDGQGSSRKRWMPERVVLGVAYDTPVPGYRVDTTNLLRLWKSEAVESFDFAAFNTGDYDRAVQEKLASETLTKVLYPNDEPAQGKQLRLEQQAFFVSCSLQDMISMHLRGRERFEGAEVRFAVQLNDTHPSIAVAELMRLLLDEHGWDWDRSWAATQRSLAYTNHTLLPEALETWPLELFGRVLPRHLEVIREIDRRFLEVVRARWPGDTAREARMAIVDEAGSCVRMAHLAVVGCHAVNGVAALHTELLQRHVLRDFHELWPGRFHNVTNGVTPRRFVLLANPGLAELIGSRIGDGWITRPEQELPRLEPYVQDAGFRDAWRAVKHANKRALARFAHDRLGLLLDPETMFDVQVKRLHEYKRQHLNVLHVILRWNELRGGGTHAGPRPARGQVMVPRTVIFGGKAAPSYWMAKLIIRLIHGVAEVLDADRATRDLLRVVFIPDFNVKRAHHVYPAADLSEQISTAGMEASGTGNMKFAFNGALTIGTLDGANVEIREAVGAENFFLFGLTAEEVARRRADGYQPGHHVDGNPALAEALQQIADGVFSRGDRSLFQPLVDNLRHHDPFLALADLDAYVECQRSVDEAFADTERWTAMSILNVARMGRFSSDRAVREYCERIWCTHAVPIELPALEHPAPLLT